MRSIGVSIFILMFFFSAEIINATNTDISAYSPENAILDKNEPPRRPTADDTGLNATIDGLDNLNLLDQPASELERQGGEFGRLSMTKVLKSVLINSTTGFSSYVRVLLGIQTGTAASIILELAQWLIILNHAFAIYQLLKGSLGGSL